MKFRSVLFLLDQYHLDSANLDDYYCIAKDFINDDLTVIFQEIFLQLP